MAGARHGSGAGRAGREAPRTGVRRATALLSHLVSAVLAGMSAGRSDTLRRWHATNRRLIDSTRRGILRLEVLRAAGILR